MNKINREKIRGFIAKNYHMDKETIKDETSLTKGGAIDSMGIVEMINFLEKEFNITVNDDEIGPENFESLNSIVSYVEQKLTAKNLKKA